MNRNELVDAVAGKAELSKSAANKAVEAVFDSIAVMPTVATAAARTSAPSNGPAPFSPPPAFNQNDDDQDESQAPAAVRVGVARFASWQHSVQLVTEA